MPGDFQLDHAVISTYCGKTARLLGTLCAPGGLFSSYMYYGISTFICQVFDS